VCENNPTTQRKESHIEICLNPVVEGQKTTELDTFVLEYDALPDIDLDAVDLGCELLGKRLRAPVLIGAITGGTGRAATINRNLATAAAKLGVGLCLGSQRAMLEDERLSETFDVRKQRPDLPLVLGNLGAVQLNRGVTAAHIQAGVERLGLDGVIFHLNPLQEAIQPEGDTCFSGLSARLRAVVAELTFPCLVKEVGAGISRRTATKLAAMKLAGVEAAGVGGTSWAMVEAMRGADSVRAQAGRDLAGFGIPTARAVNFCRAAFPRRTVIASGGIRTGYQAAVALALGANGVALARPLLEPALLSATAVERALAGVIEGLRVTMFCCGCKKLDDLQSVRFVDGPAWADISGGRLGRTRSTAATGGHR
jgi:isopentenyl-diphosphate delta-isomerase